MKSRELNRALFFSWFVGRSSESLFWLLGGTCVEMNLYGSARKAQVESRPSQNRVSVDGRGYRSSVLKKDLRFSPSVKALKCYNMICEVSHMARSDILQILENCELFGGLEKAISKK